MHFKASTDFKRGKNTYLMKIFLQWMTQSLDLKACFWKNHAMSDNYDKDNDKNNCMYVCMYVYLPHPGSTITDFYKGFKQQ